MKVLIAGLGSIGQRHLRNVIQHFKGDVDLTAYRVRKDSRVISPKLIVEPDIELSQKYPFREFHDLDKALADKPDCVLICNPNHLHIPVALKAAEAGCHLFIEKPLSHNLEGTEKLIRILEEKKLTHFIGFQLRFHPVYLKMKELLTSRSIGRLFSVHAEVGEYLPDWHKWEDYREMYASRKDQGGGVILTQIHEIDYLISLFGNPKSVYSIGGHLSSLEMDVEDSVDILMEFKNHGKLLPVTLHMDYLQKPPSRKCRVIGEDGILTMDFHKLQVSKSDRNAKEEVYSYKDLDKNRMFADELSHFFQCVRENMPTQVPVNTALQSLKVALAMKQSMELGRKIELDEI